MNNTDKLRSILAEKECEHVQAERAFREAQRKIERINNDPIHIFHDDVDARIYEAVDTAISACFTLASDCQRILTELDEECRPLVEEDTPTQLLLDIAYKFHQLNEDMEINSDFTGNLDGLSFGKVAKVEIRPTEESREIEQYWEHLAQQRQKEDADAAYMQKHGISKADIQQHKHYADLIRRLRAATTTAQVQALKDAFMRLEDRWEAAEYVSRCTARITELQQQEDEAKKQAEQAEQQKAHQEAICAQCNSLVSDFKAALTQQASHLLEAYTDQVHQQLNTALAQKEAHQQTLSSLGLFAFGKKKEEKAILAQLESEIGHLQDPEQIKSEKKRLNALVNKAVTAYSKKVEQYLQNRFPGLKPQTPRYEFPRNKEGEKLKILALMAPRKAYTVTEIMQQTEQSASYVTMLLNQMREAGDVQRSGVNGRAVFTITSGGKKRLEQYRIPNETKGEDATYAALPCPTPPAVKTIFD